MGKRGRPGTRRPGAKPRKIYLAGYLDYFNDIVAALRLGTSELICRWVIEEAGWRLSEEEFRVAAKLGPSHFTRCWVQGGIVVRPDRQGRDQPEARWCWRGDGSNGTIRPWIPPDIWNLWGKVACDLDGCSRGWWLTMKVWKEHQAVEEVARHRREDWFAERQATLRQWDPTNFSIPE